MSKLSETLHFRITADEVQRLDQAVKKSGTKNRSRFLRQVVTGSLATNNISLTVDFLQELKALRVDIEHVENTLNHLLLMACIKESDDCQHLEDIYKELYQKVMSLSQLFVAFND